MASKYPKPPDYEMDRLDALLSDAERDLIFHVQRLNGIMALSNERDGRPNPMCKRSYDLLDGTLATLQEHRRK